MSKKAAKTPDAFALSADPAPAAKRKGGRADKPSPLRKLIDQYYADLAEFAHQNVMYEMGTRPAFHALLQAEGRKHGWTLIAEHEKKVNGATIRPDGTFKDTMNLVRGYWEAKDTDDKLDAEIAKKKKKGYPLTNTIFEDTATAALFQHGQEILRVDMKDPIKLEELVNQFFAYIEPEIEEFEEAVEQFKERVPDLASGLAKKIADAHKTNAKFKAAFADFFDLCRTSLNPNLSQAAVDEMLIQHILTERLIREIFDNPEFVRRNVIAAEVEKVMLAMTSQSFDRNTYLKELDRFYVAIEHAARTMTDFSDKQHFLNTVYERFFQGYSVKLADTMGIVYTPQAIVDFMCASVEEVLKTEFGKTLASDDVYLIDPCTGTGNFIVNLIRRIPKTKLEGVYRHRLFANEIMLLPYYIAALNIEHAYYEQTGTYEPFEGLCFVDTLDLAEHAQGSFGFVTAANAVRVERQKRAPINVVIGNPPYNSDQESENDNNRNRPYDVVDGRVRATYGEASTATNKNKLTDPFVKFLRWATDRLDRRGGIVAFITNNTFVDGKPFDGLRRCLLREFDHVYHVDLHGDVRRNPKLSGTTHNVFGIQTGVGITVAVRRPGAQSPGVVDYAVAEENATRVQKLDWLSGATALSGIHWSRLSPSDDADWLLLEHDREFKELIPIALKSVKSGAGIAEGAIFGMYGPGVQTNRDDWVYGFDRDAVSKNAATMIETYNAEIDRWNRAKRPKDVDGFVINDERKIKWSSRLKETFVRGEYAEHTDAKLRRAIYRPFTERWLFFDSIVNHRPGQMPRVFPTVKSEGENVAIFCTNHSQIDFSALAVARLPDVHIGGRPGTCFPFYVYDEDGSNRRENVTDWALAQFRAHYADKKISKRDIFDYVYGLLHHPGYRAKFADNLKRELPRIPFAPDFAAFAAAGKALMALHLNYETVDPYPLDFVETPGLPLSYRVADKMRPSKDKTKLTVNDSLTLANLPAAAFDYRLGNRSAVEWVIDQYQVHTDPRSGITSDPNRAGDDRHIVDLVGRVVAVSVRTVEIVAGLPAAYAAVPA